MTLEYTIAGHAVNEDTLAFDVMKEVVSGDGVFLGTLHTVKQMRKGVIFTPAISERTPNSGEDEQAGIVARARRRAAEILASHEVEPLPEDVSRQLDEIMAEARRELVK